jgi:hypothetical protein
MNVRPPDGHWRLLIQRNFESFGFEAHIALERLSGKRPTVDLLARR